MRHYVYLISFLFIWEEGDPYLAVLRVYYLLTLHSGITPYYALEIISGAED